MKKFLGILFLTIALIGVAIAQDNHDVVTDKTTTDQTQRKDVDDTISDEKSTQQCSKGHDNCRLKHDEGWEFDEVTDKVEKDKSRSMSKVEIRVGKNLTELPYLEQRIKNPSSPPEQRLALRNEFDRRLRQVEGDLRWAARSCNNGSSKTYISRVRALLKKALRQEHGYLRGVKEEMRNRFDWIERDMGKMKIKLNTVYSAVTDKDDNVIYSERLQQQLVDSGIANRDGSVNKVIDIVDKRMAEYGMPKDKKGKPVNITTQIQTIWDNMSLIGRGIFFLAVGLLVYAIILRRR